MTTQDDWAAWLDPFDDSPAGADTGPDAPVGRPTGGGRQAEAAARVRAALADESTWQAPPPDLRARLLAAATAAPDTAPADTAPTDTAPADEVSQRRARRRRGRGVGVGTGLGFLAGAAAAAAVAVAVATWPAGSQAETFQLAATAENPDAVVTAEVESLSAGVAITLDITGLPAAPEGTYYAAWLEGERGVVPAGSFHWREGGIPIWLWSGVEPADYPRFYVTVETEGTPPGPSGTVVLDGTIAG